MPAIHAAHIFGDRAAWNGPQGRWPAWLALMLILALGSPALAQESDQPSKDPVAASSTGLRGLDRIGMPIGEEGISVAGTAGFGYLESMGSVKGSHQRYAGRLAIGAHLVEGLSAALVLDGRYDRHPNDGMGKDSSAVGDPQVLVRYGLRLNPEVQLGFEGGLRVPGSEAPSVKLSASTVDLKALLALMQLKPVSIHVLAGFRIDKSSNAAPELDRLREGDRISLGMSAGNQILSGLGAHYVVNKDLSAYLEGTYEPILGHHVVSYSPIRMGIGARYNLMPGLLIEGTVTAALNKRPSVAPTAPLVPIEPRVLVMVGLRYSFMQPEPARKTSEEEPPPVIAAPEPEPIKTAEFHGLVMDEYGAPLGGARVELRAGDTALEAFTDDNGLYNFESVPFGQITIEASADGYSTVDWQVLFDADVAQQQVPVNLKKAEPLGQLRGLVRSWNSEPISASVEIRDERNKPVTSAQADAEGRFEIDLHEGTYKVKVTARGYKSQTHKISVGERGVTILNLDLRSN